MPHVQVTLMKFVFLWHVSTRVSAWEESPPEPCGVCRPSSKPLASCCFGDFLLLSWSTERRSSRTTNYLSLADTTKLEVIPEEDDVTGRTWEGVKVSRFEPLNETWAEDSVLPGGQEDKDSSILNQTQWMSLFDWILFGSSEHQIWPLTWPYRAPAQVKIPVKRTDTSSRVSLQLCTKSLLLFCWCRKNTMSELRCFY